MSPNDDWFDALLVQYPRVAIVGGPRTGKTTLAASVTDRPVFGTDALMHLPWEDVPQAVIGRAVELGDRWVVEGVQTARALRKGLTPDAVVMLTAPRVRQTPQQAAMAKGIAGIMDGITMRLALMGIPTFRR